MCGVAGGVVCGIVSRVVGGVANRVVSGVLYRVVRVVVSGGCGHEEVLAVPAVMPGVRSGQSEVSIQVT